MPTNIRSEVFIDALTHLFARIWVGVMDGPNYRPGMDLSIIRASVFYITHLSSANPVRRYINRANIECHLHLYFCSDVANHPGPSLTSDDANSFEQDLAWT